ncbi:MAG: hypothetical protein KBD01_13905 [Acidobacteria bacterium]|nr:hypothetical protein [Acidobacteriota bacterium]
MTITIVCTCGQHNGVSEDELDSARCWRCDRPLLKPAGAKSAPPRPDRAPEAAVLGRRRRS